jgi:hypothetical protein
MSTPAITLALTLEDASAAFEPGAPISGVASWSAPAPPRGMELRLSWRLEGQWERDLKIASTLPLADPRATEQRPFILPAPAAPYSFHGTLLSLTWTLELVTLPSEEKTAIALIIAPGRRNIDLRDTGARR